MNIILIHLGNKKIPYLIDVIFHLIYFNNNNVHLLVNKKTFNNLKNLKIIKKINLVNIDNLEKSYEHKYFLKKTKLDKKWYHGFWLRTTERFFYLENFSKKYKLSNIIHLENDNLIFYNLNKLKEKLYKIYKIGVTLLNDKYCIPGIIYFRNYKHTKLITDHIYNYNKKIFKSKKMNDMGILADLKKKNKNIKLLPTINKDLAKLVPQKVKQEYYKNFNKLKFIFDAAAIGQKLDGLDVNIHKNNGSFINDRNIIHPNNLEIVIKKFKVINKPF